MELVFFLAILFLVAFYEAWQRNLPIYEIRLTIKQNIFAITFVNAPSMFRAILFIYLFYCRSERIFSKDESR
jgi:predicted membrane protein